MSTKFKFNKKIEIKNGTCANILMLIRTILRQRIKLVEMKGDINTKHIVKTEIIISK